MAITASLLATLPKPFIPPAVDRAALPSAQSDDILLVPASGPEYVQTAYLNAEEWKGPLTIDQYLDREVDLQATELTKHGRITGWLLTSKALPTNSDGTRVILASCESIPISAYIARAGDVQQVQAHGIASVYTRSEYRGKGYAGRMMADLGKKLESWQQLNDHQNPFSILFSDIGSKFYAQFGWKNFESTHIHLAPLTHPDYQRLSTHFPAVQDLSTTELLTLPTTQYLREHLQQLSAQRTSVTFVAVAPDLDHFQWHHAREEFQAKVLGKDSPSIKGAIHRQTGLGVIWARKFTAEPNNRQLNILHTIIPPALEASDDTHRALAALILRSQLEAGTWDLVAGVEIWDPSDMVIASAQLLRSSETSKVDIITRDKEHLCCLRWSATEEGDPEWTTKQKYAWC